MRILARLLPGLRLPIPIYLDFQELVDTDEPNRTVETRVVVNGYLHDPDFDKSYTLSAITSLLDTPPPNPLEDLRTPTLFLVPTRGVWPSYTHELYGRLPAIRKRKVEVDGSVFWMVSHPTEAADAICGWFDETV